MNGYVNKKQCWWVMLCKIGLDMMPNIVKSQEDIKHIHVFPHKLQRQEVPFQIPTKIQTHFELEINIWFYLPSSHTMCIPDAIHNRK